ncbi:MAG: hypothetical protein NTV51_29545 [Verrucomicrobia bacterium]|nr:hypothetical protein [Verrucomicrobiota bacterium]
MKPAGNAGPGRARAARRGGCLIRLMLLGVVLAAAGALAWMLLLPVVVTSRIRARTGFEVRVASLSCNAFTGRLVVRGLVLANPPSFPVGDFVELREFSTAGDAWALWSDRLVIDDLTLDVRKVTLVRRPDGRSNAEVFQEKLLGGPGAPTAGTVTTPAPPGPERPLPTAAGRKFLIRRFALRFDRLATVDYSGVSPVTHEFALGVDQRYENLTDPKQLLVPEVLRRLVAANLDPAVASLVPGDLGRALGNAAREAAGRGEGMLREAEGRASDLFKGLREKLEESRKP